VADLPVLEDRADRLPEGQADQVLVAQAGDRVEEGQVEGPVEAPEGPVEAPEGPVGQADRYREARQDWDPVRNRQISLRSAVPFIRGLPSKRR